MVRDRHTAATKSVGNLYVRMLLVEDNPAEARFLQELLKGTLFGRFDLVHTQRLWDAIAYLNKESFDLILLDLTLPDSQGIESLDSLIQQAPSLPIVVLTNTNDEELAVEAVRHGAQDYLVKRNINQDLLVRSLRYAIQRKQSQEALREANEILELRVQDRTHELETANKRLQREVERRQQVQERLELAQKAGKIGTFEWNIQSNEVTWSAELEALYGLTPGSFGGRYDRWVQTIHPDDRTRTERELWRAIEQKQGLDTEFRILHTQEDTRWIAVKSSLFHDTTGRPQRMIGIHMDITEKKQLEAQFLRAQRMESLGTLASGIAHDLNNILTPILAVVQLLPLKFPDLSEQNTQLLKTLETSARRGAELVKQILSFARGVEGKRVSLQVDYLLVEIRQILEQTMPKSIEIKMDLPADLWAISGDVTQLHQVFVNLCVNARDAMPQGGILQITAKNQFLAEQQARMHLEANPGPYVVVTIADTGVGIPANHLHQIFDPFFTTKDVGKGTGLGLSAVLGIVKSHGGFADVQSEVGKGSQFQIYLPAIQATTANADEGMELLSGQGELILVVDDETIVCEAVKITLETYNYQVLMAKDGVEAIALIAQHKNEIQAVLMDLMMPSMDGLATIPLMQRLKPDLIAIAMSGVHSKEAVAQAHKIGFHGFLPKPFTTLELLQILQKRQ
ncbi:MAG: response regulator [Oscillatoriales cyanobacterium C42_A2020_001]|nr:response regulator [Leptolyngbyaceae cyanobacterium C42_A2020_001]